MHTLPASFLENRDLRFHLRGFPVPLCHCFGAYLSPSSLSQPQHLFMMLFTPDNSRSDEGGFFFGLWHLGQIGPCYWHGFCALCDTPLTADERITVPLALMSRLAVAFLRLMDCRRVFLYSYRDQPIIGGPCVLWIGRGRINIGAWRYEYTL